MLEHLLESLLQEGWEEIRRQRLEVTGKVTPQHLTVDRWITVIEPSFVFSTAWQEVLQWEHLTVSECKIFSRKQDLPLSPLLKYCQELLYYNCYAFNVLQLYPWLHQFNTNQLRFEIERLNEMSVFFWYLKKYHAWKVKVNAEIYDYCFGLYLTTVAFTMMLGVDHAVRGPVRKSLIFIHGTSIILVL